MLRFHRLAFVVNRQKNGANPLARELIEIARQAGVRKIKMTSRRRLPAGWLRGWDACCVIGGDGTLLSTVTEAALQRVPVIGINQGSLGFLTTFSAEEARSRFGELLRGAYRIAWRTLLDCRTGARRHALALNDVLIKDEINSRLVRLEVFANGKLVTDYLCDGVVFSTPTGSTAYNLSAGGPIVQPDSGVISLTPICPHTLSNRTIIFRDRVRLAVFNRTKHSRLLVAMDGQRNLVVTRGSPIKVTLARHRFALVQQRDYSHFAVIRAKLRWSGGFADKK